MCIRDRAKAALKTAKEEKVSADKALATAKGELEVLTKAHDVAVLARKSAGQDLFRKREASKEATDTYTAVSYTHLRISSNSGSILNP